LSGRRASGAEACAACKAAIVTVVSIIYDPESKYTADRLPGSRHGQHVIKNAPCKASAAASIQKPNQETGSSFTKHTSGNGKDGDPKSKGEHGTRRHDYTTGYRPQMG
jgi:hypothetical protein